jgi:serine/threonine protein kinase
MPSAFSDEFQALWPTLAADSTLHAHSADATLRADAVRVADASRRSGAALSTRDLPQISLAPGAALPAAAARADDPAADIVLLDVLGEGGMGRVYLARQQSLGRHIAVKTVRAEAESAETRAALLHEARISGGLEHPNIVPVHALGLDPAGLPVLVMKRVEGCSWRDLLRDADHPAWARLPVRHADPLVTHIEVLVAVCNALQLAHARGVVHRDIKPENVMVGEFGEVYLLDWGIASSEASRARPEAQRVRLLGTPAYMAPEMVRGREDQLDARTDVYLLGATLHEVLTGTPPHGGERIHDVLLAAFSSEPATYPPAAPTELVALCRDAMHRDSARRPPTIVAFRERLAGYLRHRASVALSDSAAASLARLHAVPGVVECRADALRSPEAWGLMTECRFGCLQALREWPENVDARRTLQSVLESMIERELVERNPAAARTLVDELPEPRPELAARLGALVEEIEAQRRREERAREMAREMDLSVSTRSRAASFVVALVFSVLACGVLLYQYYLGGGVIPVAQLVQIDAALVVTAIGAFVIARRKLLANVVNRRVSWLTAVALGSILTSDTLSWIVGLDAPQALVHTMFTLAVGMAVCALMGLKNVGWLAAIELAGAVTAALFPRYSMLATSFTVLGALSVAAWLFSTGRMRWSTYEASES